MGFDFKAEIPFISDCLVDAKCLKPILRACCAIVHEEAVTFLFKKQNPKKKQVHSQEVVPVGISVPKKCLGFVVRTCLEVEFFLWQGAGEECKSGGLVRPSG